MDITLTGRITDVVIKDYDDSVGIYFNIGKEETVLEQLPCYSIFRKSGDISDNKAVNYFKSIDSEKDYCVEGAICSDKDKTNFQVHCIYQVPEKIYA